jgi:hypothetical protein
MDEILTREEIEKRYPNEWVMIEDPEVDEHNEVLRGKVIFHHPDRLTAYQALFKSKAKRCASLFTGPPIPEGMEVII